VVVVLVVAAVVILIGTVVVAMGNGGEMARFPADVRPLDADIETASDVALLRPPAAMWGYDKRATDEALNAVAEQVTQRDVEIAVLRQQIADLRAPAPRGPARRGPAPRGSAPRGPVPGPPGAPSQDQRQGGGLPGQAGPPETQPWSPWQRSIPPRPPDNGQPENDK
jgi:hypothetical protein